MVRLSKNLKPININSFFPTLINYFSEEKSILAAYLYGSYGTAAQTPLSDLDMALLLYPGNENNFDKYLEVQSAVCSITQEDDVNIIILNSIPIILQFKILSSGKIIYERDSVKVNYYHEMVCKYYGDYIIDYLQFCQDYDQSLREAYLGGRKGKTTC